MSEVAGRQASGYAERIAESLIGCGRGDTQSLGRLYDDSISWVYPLASAATRDSGDARRLTTSIYQRIWRASGLFDTSGSCAVAWLIGEVRRQVVAERPA